MSKVGHPDFEELLSAYLDGELSARDRSQVERLLAADPAARRSLEELRRTVNLVRALPRHGAPAAVLEDLRIQLERADLLDADRDEFDRGRVVRRGRGLRWLAMAASLAIVSSAGWWIWSSGLSPWQKRDRIADQSGARQEVPALSTPGRSLTSEESADQGRGRKGAAETSADGDRSVSAADSHRRAAAGRRESPVPAPVTGVSPGDPSKAANGSTPVAAVQDGRRTVSNERAVSSSPSGISETTNGEAFDEPIRVQVAADSESDVVRLKSLVQRELVVQHGAVVHASRVDQDRSATRRGGDRKKPSSSPVVDELAVEAPVEVVNHVITQLGQPSSRARFVSVELEGRSARGVAPVQSALADLAGRRASSRGNALPLRAMPEGAAGTGGSGIIESVYRVFQVDPAAPSEQDAAAVSGAHTPMEGDSAEDRARALTNQSMEVQADSEVNPLTPDGAVAGEARQETERRSGPPPSLVERRLREAASQKAPGFRSRESKIQGLHQPGQESEPGAPQSTQTLRVVFEFVIDAGSEFETARKPADSDTDRSKKEQPESTSREKKEEGEIGPR